jgi:hypothetical protein
MMNPKLRAWSAAFSCTVSALAATTRVYAQPQPAAESASSPWPYALPQLTWRDMMIVPSTPVSKGPNARRSFLPSRRLFDGGWSGCKDTEDPWLPRHDEGTFAVGVQQLVMMRAKPGLTLFGFSQWGCGAEPFAGIGLTYAITITKAISLELSFGAIYAPYVTSTAGPTTGAASRADLVVDHGGGNVSRLSLGPASLSYRRVF